MVILFMQYLIIFLISMVPLIELRGATVSYTHLFYRGCMRLAPADFLEQDLEIVCKSLDFCQKHKMI